jgi:phenylpropionate dioxygenase-like ring-hydroxylating dioxygenase large terminal subunit
MNCSKGASCFVSVTATGGTLTFLVVEPTLPWSWYSDEAVLRLEQERIFRRAWQYVGHTGQAPEAGTFFTGSAGQIPVVVTRARDGELRAFLNVCRHRGSIVAEGEGRRETLQCRYHAWTYELDGRLRTAPRSEREAGFDSEQLSLHPLSVDTWGPFVFVNPDPDAAPLTEALGPLPAQVARVLDVDALEFRFRSTFELDANWKVSCENFLECYHCAVAHPGFSAAVDVSADAYQLQADGLTSSQFGELRHRHGSFLTDGEIPHSQFHFLWPNFGINIFPGRTNLSCGPIVPISPGRTARFLDYFFGPEVGQKWIDELIEFDNQVGREDTALVERVQRGIRSGVLESGTLMPQSEQLVAHFERLCSEALAE